MPVAVVRFEGCIRERGDKPTRYAKRSIEMLLHYGYTVQVEVETPEEAKSAYAFLSKHGIPAVGIVVRGLVKPDLIFDNRCPTWGDWRVSMVTVNEINRVKHMEWVRSGR